MFAPDGARNMSIDFTITNLVHLGHVAASYITSKRCFIIHPHHLKTLPLWYPIMSRIPTSTKALVLGKKQMRTRANGKTIPYHDAAIEERALRKPGGEDVVVKVATAGFNHREVRTKWFVYCRITTPSDFNYACAAMDSNGSLSWN